MDLEKLAAVAEGAELPPTVREAVRELLSAQVLAVVDPPEGLTTLVAAGDYALVPVR